MVGEVGLGEHHQPRCVFVQAMHNAGALKPAGRGQLATGGMQHGMDQRGAQCGSPRVHDKTSWLVDDDQVLILKDNRDRVIHWNKTGAGAIGQGDFERVTCLELRAP
jgi:hypothetical protein